MIKNCNNAFIAYALYYLKLYFYCIIEKLITQFNLKHKYHSTHHALMHQTLYNNKAAYTFVQVVSLAACYNMYEFVILSEHETGSDRKKLVIVSEYVSGSDGKE